MASDRRLSRLLVDVSPLRDSRQYRLLWTGQVVSFLGSQITVVAVPYQTYRITHSTLQVGLVSLGQLAPLVLCSLAGGPVIDTHDRRKVLLLTQLLAAVTSLGLAVNATTRHPAVWPIYLITAVSAGISGLDWPARLSVIPNLIPAEDLTSAMALWQIMIQTGSVLGPAVAGLILAQLGFTGAYLFDVVTFGVALSTVARLDPLPPAGGGTPLGLAAIGEGLRYVLRDRPTFGTLAIDIDAMVFGMPRAAFPALAVRLYHGGAGVVGLLNAAPGAGALIGSLLTGWVGRIRRQGAAVVVAVVVWGSAIALFGFAPALWLGLLLLALAGAADVVSAVFRNTIVQGRVPDGLRGRTSATFIAVVTGGPRVGDAETGVAASVGGARFAVWSGGLASIVGALLVAWRIPELGRFRRASGSPEPGEGERPVEGPIEGPFEGPFEAPFE